MILLSGPNLSGNELKYVTDCIETGWVSSVGSYVTNFEKMISNHVGSKYAVATSSGTTALHLSLIVSEITEDDYVIVPNVTFIATLNAVKYVKARPILIDINPDTWQLDLDLVRDFLENKTETINGNVFYNKKRIKAIMPVHVLGNMCDMNDLLSISKEYNIDIIEDAAESLGSYFQNKHSGTFGKIGCFSFNGNKIITCGGGGVIVTDDENIALKAKHLSTQAKADSFEYFHDKIGFNYRLTNVSAAIGLAQLEQLELFIKKKHFIKDFYINNLKNIGDIKFQKVEENVDPNWWLFTISSKFQKKLLNSLNLKKMQSRPFWIPMNKLPMFENETYITNKDVSAQVYSTSLSIPCSTNITEQELEQVVRCIKDQF